MLFPSDGLPAEFVEFVPSHGLRAEIVEMQFESHYVARGIYAGGSAVGFAHVQPRGARGRCGHDYGYLAS